MINLIHDLVSLVFRDLVSVCLESTSLFLAISLENYITKLELYL